MALPKTQKWINTGDCLIGQPCSQMVIKYQLFVTLYFFIIFAFIRNLKVHILGKIVLKQEKICILLEGFKL